MLRTILLLLIILLTPASLSASYYVSDYDPDYVPYNLQEAIDNSDYQPCKSEIVSFDKTYNEYLKLYGTPISVGETLDVNYGALKEVYEEEFRQCLSRAREEELENSIKKCDFATIDSLSYDDERIYRSEINECKDERAVSNCDFEYIEDMSGSEKFKYRNEINVCELSLKPEPTAPEPAPEVIPAPKTEIPTIPEVVPIKVYEPAPTPTPTTATKPPAYKPKTPEVQEVMNEQNDTEVATGSETFEMTQEEIDALVQEKLAEAEQENTKPIPKENFFKRIWNFITSWF